VKRKLWSILLIGFFPAAVSAGTIFQDSFETSNAGDIPAGWTLADPGVANYVTNSEASDGAASFYSEGAPYQGADLQITVPGKFSSRVTARYDLKISDWPGTDGQTLANFGFSGTGTYFGIAKVDGQYELVIGADTRHEIAIPASLPKWDIAGWNEFSVTIDTAGRTARYYVNGSLVFSATGLRPYNYQGIRTNSGNAGEGGGFPAAYYDNFYVCDGTGPSCGSKTSAGSGSWVSIEGHIRLVNGTPVCAMVLANGQHMFSCDGTGSYSLTVPVGSDGLITLFVFADGLAPFSTTSGPEGFSPSLQMGPAASNSPQIGITRQVACSQKPNWVHITGDVQSYSGQPLCAMVLSNGQEMFTCDTNLGKYDVTVPVDSNGQITVFSFADGFQPYRDTFRAPSCDGAGTANLLTGTTWTGSQEVEGGGESCTWDWIVTFDTDDTGTVQSMLRSDNSTLINCVSGSGRFKYSISGTDLIVSEAQSQQCSIPELCLENFVVDTGVNLSQTLPAKIEVNESFPYQGATVYRNTVLVRQSEPDTTGVTQSEPETGLVLYIPVGQDSVTDVTGNHQVLNGSASKVLANWGETGNYAYDLRDWDDSLQVGASQYTDLGDEYTLAFTMNLTEWDSSYQCDGGVMMSNHKAFENGRGWILGVKCLEQQQNLLYFYLYGVNGDSSATRSFHTKDFRVVPGTTYHVALVGSRSQNRTAVYINGSPVEITPYGYSGGFIGTAIDGGHPLTIGREENIDIDRVNGVFDEIRLYNRALTSREIGQLAVGP